MISRHMNLTRLTTILLFFLAATFHVTADPNLKTPYDLLDPSSAPAPTALGKPIASRLVDPTTLKRLPADLGLPRVFAERNGDIETITLRNAAIALRVEIDSNRKILIDGLSDELVGIGLLAKPLRVFYLRGKEQRDSDAYHVTAWDGFQYANYSELRVVFASDDANAEVPRVTWRARLFRERPQLEQTFEFDQEEVAVAQLLATVKSLEPVMPANLFGQGFAHGRPNIPDRHRFEIVGESEHLAYDIARNVGLWGFVADVGGQERISPGQFGLIQHPSFRTRRAGCSAAFVIQPFHGSIERGFRSLREYINGRYAVQGLAPSLYEWNQFWLWQGGPTQVSTGVVSEHRLFEVLQRQVKMGMEEFHLDMGWERKAGDWALSADRFPGGWKALRQFNRQHGLAFHLWVNDGATDSPGFMLDLIDKSDIGRLFMDRQTSERTCEALDAVRVHHPGFSSSCHNSTSRSNYWSWGNIHFLRDFNQIYFGEGQFWAWSNVLPEKQIAPRQDPDFPQRTEAERFFSRHDLYAGDLITRAAAYQAHWAWPFNCTAPPHCGWAWFEDRPTEQLRDRIYTYLACKFNYQWGFDPSMLRKDLIDLHLDCTAWFKANRDLLVQYQHVLGPPDGKGIDAAAHLRDGRGFIFLFNPADHEQSVDWREMLWEPELALRGPTMRTSDWTDLTHFDLLGQQDLSKPSGKVTVGPHGVKVLGIDLDDDALLSRIETERAKIGG